MKNPWVGYLTQMYKTVEKECTFSGYALVYRSIYDLYNI